MPKLTLSFKGRLLDVFHLDDGQTLIGRENDCQIAIDSLAIAPFHAKVTLDKEGCRIEILHEDFPIQVNRKGTESAELRHGDVIQIGKHTLTFSEDAIELAGELPKKEAQDEDEADEFDKELTGAKGMLQIMNGDNFGRIIPLNRNMTRIGRVGGDCAMIARRDSGYYISHLEGPGSPLVNSKPIGDESLLLNDGDVIAVGKTQMQFHT
jgi:predicted component of type VI protein secretion system